MLFISTGCREKDRDLGRSVEVARVLGLDHQEITGDARFIRKLISGPWDDEEFISVPPHGVIEETLFLDGAGQEVSVNG